MNFKKDARILPVNGKRVKCVQEPDAAVLGRARPQNTVAFVDADGQPGLMTTEKWNALEKASQ